MSSCGLGADLLLEISLPCDLTIVLFSQVNLVNLVHHMGGTIRKDFSAKVTHLIAHSTHGEKYRVCVPSIYSLVYCRIVGFFNVSCSVRHKDFKSD